MTDNPTTAAAADWALVTGDATGWVWQRDDFAARLRRVLICQRFHSWVLTLHGSRKTCDACLVRKASSVPVSLPDGLTVSEPTYKWPSTTGSTNDR